MDFLSPEKKRAHRIRLTIGYGLMAVAIAIATLIVVFAASGYDIDRKTGDIIQNGLVVIDAHPEAADIYLNDQFKGTTNTRLVLPAGGYNLELRRAGFRSWSHQVQLEATSIEQLVYPFLFPEKLVTKTINTLNAKSIHATQSPDQRWLLIPSPDKTANFQLYDLNDQNNRSTTLVLPSDVYTTASGTHSFVAVEWSSDNTHLLMKHTWNKGSEFIVVDRGRITSSYNLSKLFPKVTISQVTLRDKRPDQFYLYDKTKTTISRAIRGGADLTTITSNVTSFTPYQDTMIFYTTSPASKKANTVQARIWDDGKDYMLRELPVGSKYFLEMASFNSHLYAVAGSAADGRIYIYQDPLGELKRSRQPNAFRVLVVPQAEYVSFSPITRFISVQHGSNIAVYDAETGRQYRYDMKLPLIMGQAATWMDGHRLVLTSGGKVHVFDFDGKNVQTLSANQATQVPLFDSDYKALYTFAPTDKNTKLQLNRTELRLVTN